MMGKRFFNLKMYLEVELELDDQVIDVVDDEWRNVLHDLNTPEEIAKMVASNLLQGSSLSQLEGWGDQPDRNAQLGVLDVYVEEVSEV